MTSHQHTSLIFPLMSLLKYPYKSRHTQTHADTRRHTQTHADTRRHTQTHADTKTRRRIMQRTITVKFKPHYTNTSSLYIYNKKLYVYYLITKKIFEYLSAGLILDSIRFVSKEWHQYPMCMKMGRMERMERAGESNYHKGSLTWFILSRSKALWRSIFRLYRDPRRFSKAGNWSFVIPVCLWWD